MLLVRTADYTATNGTSVVLGIAATASDVVNVVAYGAFNVADTYTQAQANAAFYQTAVTPMAGKNVLINSDFKVNQRENGLVTSSTIFVVDRFSLNFSGGTCSGQQKTFSPGAGISGISSVENFLEYISSSQSATSDFMRCRGAFEDVYTFAGETVTFSFYAKAASGTPKIALGFSQNFGSGGSTTVTTKVGEVTLSTSFERYSITFTMPSISGKTIGAGSYNTVQFFMSAGSSVDSGIWGIGVQNNTFQFTAFQLEKGSVATAFQTATGNPASELAVCQRYYWQLPGTTTGVDILMRVFNIGALTNNLSVQIPFPVTMRFKPTLVVWGDISDGTSKSFDTVVSQQFNGGWAIMNSVPAGGYVDLNFVTASSEL